MNEQDEKAFEEWFLNYSSWRVTMSRQESCQTAWLAACEYKQKEIDDLLEQNKKLLEHISRSSNGVISNDSCLV
jgi:hypothetical protein